jgi:hypothetical protein
MADEERIRYLRWLCQGALDYASCSFEGSVPIVALGREDWIPEDFPKGTLVYQTASRSMYRISRPFLEKWLANNPAKDARHEDAVV